MTRFATLTAIFAAAGIALAPLPAAAAPDGEDIAKIIAGIAVAGIVAKAIDDRNDRKVTTRSSTVTEFGRFGTSEDRYRDDRYRDGRSYDGRRVIDGTIRPYREDDRRGPKDKRGYKQQALPDRCLLQIDTDRGSRLAYGARCLQQNYRHANKLPQSCETVVRTPRGFRTVYGARCLSRDGWRVAGR